MFIKKLLNSTKLYALANLFFAAANAISSILIVKFFGLRVYGYITYFNSFDTIIDYFGGHARSTFEYVSANWVYFNYCVLCFDFSTTRPNSHKSLSNVYFFKPW